MMEREKKNFDSAAMECCVVCGERTGERKGRSVEKRCHYIEGSGQLCSECYTQLYREEAPLCALDLRALIVRPGGKRIRENDFLWSVCSNILSF